jgi:very-short-patch-repair endonuclease
LKEANNQKLDERRKDYIIRLKDACNKKGYELLSDESEIDCNVSIIRYKCQLHGEQKMKVANMLCNKGCPKCVAINNRKRFQLKQDEVIQRVKQCGGILLNPEDYINQDRYNLRFICSECGEEFISCLQKYTQHGGQVCKECSGRESLGEKKIRHYLEEHGVEFKEYYWFKDCRDINPLPFDFYIPKMNTIIEFDGRQHFQETDHFSYSYKKVVEHDTIKNNYCADKNIRLIRISYKQINHITEILDKQLFT